MNDVAIANPATTGPWDFVRFAAKTQLALAFLFIAGALDLLLSSKGGSSAYEDRGAGSPIQQAITLALYLPSIAFIIGALGRPLRTASRAWVFVLLLILFVVSALWSVEPDVTLRRVVATWLATLFVLHLACYFTPRQFIQLLAYVCVALLVASTLAIAVPGLGIPSEGVQAGKLRGIFPQKNSFGNFLAFAIMFFIMCGITAPKGDRWRFAWFGLAAFALIELVLANARTPLISMIAGLAAAWAAAFIYFPRGWQQRLTTPLRAGIVGTGFITVVIVLPLTAAGILALLGRNLTLTGRVKLWQYAIDIGAERPWFGAGFKAFWTDKLTFDLRVLHQHWGALSGGLKKLTANAHNGYLDTWLDLGFVGLALLLIFFATLAVKANRALRETRDTIYLWHIAVLTFLTIYYLTNSGIFDHNDLCWFILAYAFMSLCRREADARAPRPVAVPARPGIAAG